MMAGGKGREGQTMRNAIVALAFCLPSAGIAEAKDTRVTLPVTSVSVYPGDTLTADIVSDREMVVRGTLSRSIAASRDQVVGKVARRALPAGQAIPLHALREPYAFKEGQRVPIVFGDGALTIQSIGVALEPGVVGQTVSVRNAETGITLRGAVRGDGKVSVGDTP